MRPISLWLSLAVVAACGPSSKDGDDDGGSGHGTGGDDAGKCQALIDDAEQCFDSYCGSSSSAFCQCWGVGADLNAKSCTCTPYLPSSICAAVNLDAYVPGTFNCQAASDELDTYCADPECSTPDAEADDSPITLGDGTLSDCDSDGDAISGVIQDDTDIDWFQYQGVDTVGCVVDPYASIEADADATVCMRFTCVAGTLSLTCPADASDYADGAGCCKKNALLVESVACVGDDDLYVDVVIGEPTFACMPYTVNFHY